MTMGVLVGGISKLVKGVSNFFGLSSIFTSIKDKIFGTEAKTDTDRIVQANEDIISAVKGELAKDRRSIFTKIKDKAFGNIKHNVGVMKESAVTFGKKTLNDMSGMFSKGLKSSKFGKTFSNMGKKFDKGFKNLNKQLPQKRDAKGRFAKRDKTEILIETMKRMSEGVWGILKVNEDAADEAKKGKGGGMFGKLLGGAKGFAKFGKRIVMMIGLGLMTGLKVVRVKVFAVLGTKMFGMLGLALTGGGLIGTYLLNPLLKWFDDTFGTGIISMIGGLMVKIVAGLESLPLIGGLIQKITGGEASAAIQKITGGEASAAIASNQKKASLDAETAGYQNVAARVKSGELQKGSTEVLGLLDKVKSGDYEIKPVQAVDKTQITSQVIEQKISEAATYMKQQAQAVSNTVVNNTQQIVKSLPAVDDLGTALASYGG